MAYKRKTSAISTAPDTAYLTCPAGKTDAIYGLTVFNKSAQQQSVTLYATDSEAGAGTELPLCEALAVPAGKRILLLLDKEKITLVGGDAIKGHATGSGLRVRAEYVEG
jgi:hypothetical protein